MRVRILTGDCRKVLRALPDESVHCVVTSPPYWGLRDYGVVGQIGLETTFADFIEEMRGVFREVRRVLRGDGTLWLNLGDSYAAHRTGTPMGLKPKDLVGIPWRVAFALQADGWWLRQDIIWSKPNPMPESVTDRCTKAHEYLFMFAKSERYYFDADAIRNPPSEALLRQVADGYNGADTKDFAASGAQSASGTKANIIRRAREKIDKQRGHRRKHAGFNDRWDYLSREEQMALGSNKRSVWEIATAPFPEAHFATFPPALIEPCIKAGCPEGGTVLDPFGGAGTTGLVADRLGRKAILIELNPSYIDVAKNRIRADAGLLAEVSA